MRRMQQMAGQMGMFNPMAIPFGAYGAYAQAVSGGPDVCGGGSGSPANCLEPDPRQHQLPKGREVQVFGCHHPILAPLHGRVPSGLCSLLAEVLEDPQSPSHPCILCSPLQASPQASRPPTFFHIGACSKSACQTCSHHPHIGGTELGQRFGSKNASSPHSFSNVQIWPVSTKAPVPTHLCENIWTEIHAKLIVQRLIQHVSRASGVTSP